MIRIEGLHFAYESGFQLAVDALHIEHGKRLAIIGPSGCGKTTLLKLLAGIELPARGRVHIADRELGALSEAQRRAFRIRHIGFVFQSFELLPYLSVLDNVVYPYRIGAGAALDDTIFERARGLATQLGLLQRLQRRPAGLSHGEQQRVAICRALITRPQLVLADEPTGNLDPRTKHAALDLLIDAVRDHQATLVTVTHDHELLDRFDDVLELE